MYSVSPALPQGLSINQGDGALAGTPVALAPRATYTVTASNSAGSIAATLSIVVTTVAPAISYASPSYSFTVGVAAQAITPKAKGGTIVSWSVSPALPDGLTLNATDGTISGTPTAAAASAAYAVTAVNSGGQSTATLTIAVAAGPLFDLGHGTAITFTRLINNVLLSEDNFGHWILWNYAAGTQVAAGNNAPILPINGGSLPEVAPVGMEGATVVFQTPTGLEVRSAASGKVLSEIVTNPVWWELAADGSYVCAGNAAELTAWSPSGTVLFTIPGDYSHAVVYAAASQIQIGVGPAGANVIQTVSVPAGAATLSPAFQGRFQSWFTDGGRFFSAVLSSTGPSTWWVYSPLAVQQDLFMLKTNSLTGEGPWYWSCTGSVIALYAVGAAGTPTSTYSGSQALSAGKTVLIVSAATSSQVTLLDLSGGSPVATNYTLPISPSAYASAYAATSSATWVLGNQFGVLLDGASVATQARYLTYGAPLSISGSTNNVTIATASGRVLTFNPATGALLGTIEARVDKVAVSSDGSALAALELGSAYGAFFPASTANTLTMYALPAGTMSATFSATPTDPLVDMTLSESGTVLGQIFDSGHRHASHKPCRAQAEDRRLWCDTTPGMNTGPDISGNSISNPAALAGWNASCRRTHQSLGAGIRDECYATLQEWNIGYHPAGVGRGLDRQQRAARKLLLYGCSVRLHGRNDLQR